MSIASLHIRMHFPSLRVKVVNILLVSKILSPPSAVFPLSANCGPYNCRPFFFRVPVLKNPRFFAFSVLANALRLESE
jgi:hypothetical protein